MQVSYDKNDGDAQSLKQTPPRLTITAQI